MGIIYVDILLFGSLAKRAETPSGMIFENPFGYDSRHRFNGGKFVRRDGLPKLSENQD